MSEPLLPRLSRDQQIAENSKSMMAPYRAYLLSGGTRPFSEWSDAGSPGSRWIELKGMRDDPANQSAAYQALIGPQEHEAYAYDTMMQHPYLGLAKNLLNIPAYSAMKALGLSSGRSPASLDEMASGYNGMWQGLYDNLKR